MAAGRPLKFKSVEELQEKIDSYFEYCDEKQKPYTITGLAGWLDTSRETLLEYEERPEFVDTIKAAKIKCEQWVEENAMMNRTNATFAIFNLKNNYGWKDKYENENTVNLKVDNISELPNDELIKLATGSKE